MQGFAQFLIPKYDPTIEDSYRYSVFVEKSPTYVRDRKQIDVDGTPYMLDVMDTAGQVRTSQKTVSNSARRNTAHFETRI